MFHVIRSSGAGYECLELDWEIFTWGRYLTARLPFGLKERSFKGWIILSSHFVQWFAYTTRSSTAASTTCWSVCRGTLYKRPPLELREKKGVPNYKLKEWIKRKVECIHVVRMTKDGSIGCSTPCLLCRKLIISFDLRVVCTTLQKCTRARWRTKEHLFQTDFGTSREVQSVSCKPLSCKHGVEKTIFYHTTSM
jgi:hypothetical protein